MKTTPPTAPANPPPPPLAPHTRTLAALALAASVSACSANYPPARLPPSARATIPASQAFTMDDGTVLPYRQWLPPPPPGASAAPPPHTVILALHGFNDSADAWEYPAPAFTAHGIAIIAPDQRGFGATPSRGRWPQAPALVHDAARMAAAVHARYPAARLYLMGESMGGAVLMLLAARPGPPPAPIAGLILIAPAVWSRAFMNPFLRATLAVTNALAPALRLTAGPVRVHATDNRIALVRLSQDPRTLHATRVAALHGLVDLMDQAAAAAPHMRIPALFLYGSRDELIPKRATRAMWRTLPPTARTALYPAGYHLMLRDQARAEPTQDILTYITTPTTPLPAEARAAAWLTPLPPPPNPAKPPPQDP